jgi:rhodanese-related sulfurtransferase
MERCTSHIPNSLHLSYFDIEDRYQQLDKKFTYLVYCRSGHRSLNSVNFLTKQGYDAISMNGGMNAWKQETESSCMVM